MTLQEKQNDSVDSGVCPSPADGFQNYDEAFPPLSTMTDEGEENVVVNSWQSSKRHADQLVYSFAPNQGSFADNCNNIQSDLQAIVLVDFASPIQAGATPIKRPKLNDITNRPLRSCPDLPSHQNAFSLNGAGVQFCCPTVNNSTINTSGVVPVPRTARTSPQFVVPKCFTAGSWPLRSSKGCKHANDVPFWSCTEWFCTVHKGLEFGMLSAKVGLDAAKTLAPQQQHCPTVTAATAPTIVFCNSSNKNTTSNSNASFPKDAAVSNQQINTNNNNNNGGSQSFSSSNLPDVVVDGLTFDAPRFILHIINENDSNNETENEVLNDESQNFKADLSFLSQDEEEETAANVQQDTMLTVDTVWAMTSESSMPEFTFVPFVTTSQVNVSSSFPPQEVNFCLPKFNLSNVEQQSKIGSSCNASPFNKLSEGQLSSNQASSTSLVSLDVGGQQQGRAAAAQQPSAPQTLTVPISPHTHFVPIRSESMEEAYFPKPGFDEMLGNSIDDDEYFVYRDANSESAAAARQRNASDGQCEQQKTSRQLAKSAKFGWSGSVSSLPLKFKASLPEKFVQTEEEVVGSTIGGDQAQKSKDEFEIWACKPVSINDNLLTSIQWQENADGQLIIGPFSSLTWGQVEGQPMACASNNVAMKQLAGELQINQVGVFDLCEKGSAEDEDAKVANELAQWQRQDERDEDLLLQFVGSISLLSPLDSDLLDAPTTTTLGSGER